MTFSRAELETFRDHVVPDLMPNPVRLLFVGINPSLFTAATGAHFGRPGNRFYPALARAGIIDHAFDTSAGLVAADRDQLLQLGIGITNLVSRATARADELSRAELRAGAGRLQQTVLTHRPHVVAVAGITAYRHAFDQPRASTGRQPETLAGATLFVVPNPSGLNAHAQLDDLAAAYREAALAAGLPSNGRMSP